MSYVDGFVIPVPAANKQMFIDQAREFDTLLMQFDALRVMECWGDDVPPRQDHRLLPRCPGRGGCDRGVQLGRVAGQGHA